VGIGPLNRIDLMALPAELVPQHETPAVARELVKAVKELNRSQFSGSDRQLTFRWDAHASRPVIRIVDRGTGELIEEIPAETFQKMMNDLTSKTTK
jgi:uncharacterized FlaG/YvyC family protein